ncbi:glycosyl transferase family 36 [candidate division KSB1 bacterium]|nr:glycosyl transferase family 36 [candidate division KSB1 bacterium]
MKRFGYFSNDRREFVITRPDTPAPWVNYLSNGRYTGLISNTAGGFSFYASPKDSRITRWRYNSLPIDRPGRYLYLRDRDSGDYASPTWQPTRSRLDRFECRHGLYYTRISSEWNSIESEILYFVPANDDLELWRVRLKNNGQSPRRLDLFAFVELCLGHALVDLINQPNDQHFNEVFFDRDNRILFASKRYWVTYGATVKQANQEWDRMVYFASSLDVKSWDGSKDQFIGSWRSESDPIAVEQGRCSDSEITSGDAVAALHMPLDLAAGEEKEFVVILGAAEKRHYSQTAVASVDRYRDLSNVDSAFENLQQTWNHYLNAVQVETPDDDMNTMLNVWNPYQTSVTFQCSRDASYYHGGLLFGRGFRDSCQDILGPLMARPDWVRQRILEMCRYQFRNGSTYHLYYPLTGGGEVTGHSDTPLWLPLAIVHYLKETGDFSLLEEKVRFHDKASAVVFDHAAAAIDYTLANLSERNLAKFGPGDWNDTLDYLGREGRGESVWVSMFLCYILGETVELCNELGYKERAGEYSDAYRLVSRAINDLCWDGDWYIRGTNDRRQVIGSAANRFGRIFLNTQSWAVISRVADDERARACMQAVAEHLDTPKGPQILWPAYREIDPEIGLATRCVPGKKENGAVFNHPVSWAILAECLLGHGDRAYEIYRKALPMNPVVDIDRYQVEPYVYAEYVTSPEHSTEGQASHSWLTGSSAWMLRDGLDYILGVRPVYRGLLIDPCIPAKWFGYRVQRRFRGYHFEIEVENPDHVNTGVGRLQLNNEILPDRVIDLSDDAIRDCLDREGVNRVHVVLQASKEKESL